MLVIKLQQYVKKCNNIKYNNLTSAHSFSNENISSISYSDVRHVLHLSGIIRRTKNTLVFEEYNFDEKVQGMHIWADSNIIQLQA